MTISIVIPSYNGAKFIKSALLSALNQTYPADEIIVSDDGSQDKTIEIIKAAFAEYKENQLSKTRLIIKLNPSGPSGFVNAWNRSIAMTSGDFISILHQDDILYPDFLETFVKAYQQYPHARHFFVPCDYIDGDGKILHNFVPLRSGMVLYKNNEYLKAYQKSYGPFPHIHRCPGVITHRSIFEEGCRYVNEAGHIADDDFFYRIGQFTNVVGIMKTSAAFRIHADSETGSIGNPALVQKLARDYIYQVNQWNKSSFTDKVDKYYFECSAVKAVTRNLIFAYKSNTPSFYDESISCFLELDKYKFTNNLYLQRLKMHLVWYLLLFKKFTKSYLVHR